jgi:hypothetical protein
MFQAVLNSARLSLAFGAFAALLSTSITFAQATEYARNPASKYPIAVNGMIERVGGNWESGVFRGRWICTQGIVENFSAIALAPVSPEPVGPNDPPGTTMFTKYFQAHPEADGVMMVGGTCAPWNCGDPLYGFGFTPTVDGDVYSFPGCETDFVEFNATIRNPGAQLYGFKFRGDPTNFRLSVCASDLFMETATGHAWVEMFDGQQRYSYGKYSKNTTPFSFQAVIRDDGWRQWTERVTWPLTRRRYNAALERLHEWKRLAALGDDWYWAGEQNCMDFAAKIAEAADLDVPRYRMLWIPGIQPLRSPTPDTFCASVRLWNGACYGERPRGRCQSVFGQFANLDNDTIAFSGHPGWLLARAEESPNSVASDFYSQATYHTAPDLVVGIRKTLSLTLAEAYPGRTLTLVDFGDGSDMEFASTEEPKEHGFAALGTYAARVIALDAAGVHVIRFNIQVVPKGKPIGASIQIPQLPPLLNQPENPGSEAVIAPFARTYPADVTCDWATNGEDLAMILANWGSQVPTIADIDGDGVVSGNDLAVVLAGWGAPTP